MAIQSVASLFQSLGHITWWDAPHVTQQFNGRNELGQDFGLPLNSPVASISSGRVVYAQQMQSNPGSSVGYIVQVENADGSLFHYQHLRTSSVQVGDYIRAGQVVGYSGGCPANGYASGGCRYTDQYTTGPHIEVRYTPHYDANAGAWNQRWVNPAGAFAAFGSSQTSDLMPSWATDGPAGLISQTAAPVLQLPSNIGNVFAAALGQGLSKGLNQFVQDEIHPFVDLGVRGFLVVTGVVLGAVGLFAIAAEGGRAEVKGKVNEVAESPVGGAVLGTGASVVTANALGGSRPRPTVREEAPKAPLALPAPKPALPEPEVYKVDQVAAQHQQKRLGQWKDIEGLAREVNIPKAPPSGGEATRLKQQVKVARKRGEQREVGAFRNLRRRTKNKPGKSQP